MESIPRRMISAASYVAVTTCRQTFFAQPVSVVWIHKSPRQEGLIQLQLPSLSLFLKIAIKISGTKDDFSNAKSAFS